MEYAIFALLIISVIQIYNEISVLKKRIKNQDERLNQLAKLTGNDYLSSYWIPDEIKELIIHLKRTGKEVEAVKKVREHTRLSLIEAKKYVDELN